MRLTNHFVQTSVVQDQSTVYLNFKEKWNHTKIVHNTQILHLDKTMVTAKASCITIKKSWVNNSLHLWNFTMKFHSLSCEFHSREKIHYEWNLVRFTRYSLQKKWSLMTQGVKLEWKFTLLFLESTIAFGAFIYSVH